MTKTKIGSRVISAPVPLQGSFTFDLKQYVAPGSDVTSGDIKFYVEGSDHVIDARNRKLFPFELDRSKIYILLQ